MTLRLHPEEIVEASNSPLLMIAPWWQRVRLGDVAEVTNGAAFKSSLFNSEGRGAPLVRIRDVGGNEAQVHYDGPYEERHVIEHGDLLIGMDGDFRVARWGGGRALLNQRVCRVTVKDPGLYDEHLLLHVLQPYLDAVHAVTSSVTVKHLSSRTVQDLPIPLPPRPEQAKIVAAIEEHLSRLDAADSAVSTALRRLRTFERAALSVAQQTGEVQPLGSLLVDIEAGKSFKTPGRPAEEEEWGVIKVSAMTWGSFDENENKAVPLGQSVDPRYEIREGDLLLSRANTSEYVGATVLVGHCRPRLLLSDKSMRLVPHEGIDRRWLRYALGSPHLRSQMSAVASGTSDSMRNISQAKVRHLQVRVPGLRDQKRTADEVERLLLHQGRLEDEVRTAQGRAAALRRSVLSAAFNGRLLEGGPYDEQASAPLKDPEVDHDAARTADPRQKATSL